MDRSLRDLGWRHEEGAATVVNRRPWIRCHIASHAAERPKEFLDSMKCHRRRILNPACSIKSVGELEGFDSLGLSHDWAPIQTRRVRLTREYLLRVPCHRRH